MDNLTFKDITEYDLANMVVDETATVEAEAESQDEATEEVSEETQEQSQEQVAEDFVEDAEASDESEETDTDSSEDETSDEEVVNKIKFLLSEDDEEGVEVPENAMIKLTADNQEQLVSLDELKKNWSGKVAWDKRFQELNHKKQEFENKTQKPIDKFVNEFIKASEEAGPYAAISVIAKFAGKDPVEFTSAFKSAARAEAMKYLEMDDKNRELLDKDDNFKLKEMQLKMREQEREDELKIEELQKGIKQQTESLGISVEEFVDGLNSLKAVVQEDELNSITPEKVGQWIQLNKRASVVESVLRDINPDLAADVKTVAFLSRKSLEDSLDEQKTIETIRGYYVKKQPNSAVKRVNEKVKVKAKKIQPESHELSGAKGKKEAYTFADLDELFK